MAHLLSENFKCRPCCRVRDCGANLEKCNYTSTTDTCPGAGQGCPWGKVEMDEDRSTLTKIRCDVDDS